MCIKATELQKDVFIDGVTVTENKQWGLIVAPWSPSQFVGKWPVCGIYLLQELGMNNWPTGTWNWNQSKKTKKKKLMHKYGNEANIHLMSVQAIQTYKQRKGPLTGDNSPEHYFAACKIKISLSRTLDSFNGWFNYDASCNTLGLELRRQTEHSSCTKILDTRWLTLGLKAAKW